jgi:hypothetical protein
MGDICLPLPISMTAHDGYPIPPTGLPPLNAPLPCLESPTPMMWPPGLALQQNKFTATVFHKAQFIVLDGHDCGHVIPHVTSPPTPKLPLTIMFSSRKVMFSASKVKAQGTSVGCACIFTMAMPTPMLSCAFPISMPITFPPLNVLHTVTVGMTMWDWIAGAVAIYLTMLVDALCSADPEFSNHNNWSDELAGLLGGSNVRQLLLKAGLGVVTGAAKIGLTGDGTIQVGFGSGYLGANVSYGRAKDGTNSIGISGNAAVPMGSVQGGAQHSWGAPDGSSSNQLTGSVGTPVGVGTAQRTTTTDSQGNTTTTTQTTESGGAAVPVGPPGGLPAGSGTVAGTHQTTTVQKPGQAPETTTGNYGGVGSPFGGWGKDL